MAKVETIKKRSPPDISDLIRVAHEKDKVYSDIRPDQANGRPGRP